MIELDKEKRDAIIDAMNRWATEDNTSTCSLCWYSVFNCRRCPFSEVYDQTLENCADYDTREDVLIGLAFILTILESGGL